MSIVTAFRGILRAFTLLTFLAAVTAPAQAVEQVASQVAAGFSHTCALRTDGGVKCWGNNSNGQLGDGTTTTRQTATDVSGLTSGVVAIASGSFHTCALTSSGGVKCWGFNSSGQLGDGTSTQHDLPTDVSGLTSGVAAISAGFSHTCALMANGGVKCWGNNSNGRLGDGTTTARNEPVDVSGLASGVVAITAGGSHSCAVTDKGAAKCWGLNTKNQLGDGTVSQRLTPTDVSGLGSGVVGIASGMDSEHTCAIVTGGGLKCWGKNGDGQVGDGTPNQRSTPTNVSGLTSGVAAVSVGALHTCAATTSGAAKCWGNNDFSRLGDGTNTPRLTPTDVSGLASGVAAVTAGESHSCALTSLGEIKCWGDNANRQLGDGTSGTQSQPADVVGFSGFLLTGQSVDFTLPLPSIEVGANTNLSGTASSALAVAFDTFTPTTCTVTNGTLVTSTGAGLCMLRASQAGDATFRAAPVQTRLLLVTKVTQTINFDMPANRTIVEVPFTVAATGGASGNPVTFASQTTGVCTTSGTDGSTVTLVGLGLCTIRASQAGNSNYSAAPDVDQSFTVAKAEQSINFAKLSDHVFGSPAFTVGAGASSGLAVIFSSQTPSVCTSTGTNGTDITLVAAGACTIRASQAGDGNYNPASDVDRSFNVTPATQAITFGALSSKTLGDPAFDISATGGASGNPVTFTSLTTNVCTVSGTTVTLVAAGTCTLRASQEGNANFSAAADVDQSFAVNSSSGGGGGSSGGGGGGGCAVNPTAKFDPTLMLLLLATLGQFAWRRRNRF